MKIHRSLFCGIIMSVLCGCATFNKNLDYILGKDEQYAFSAFGYPDEQYVAANGNLVYVWKTNYTSSMILPHTNNVSGTINTNAYGNYNASYNGNVGYVPYSGYEYGNYNGYSNTNVNLQSTSYQMHYFQRVCNIKIAISNHRIVSYDYSGNAGCNGYKSNLNKVVKQDKRRNK